MVVVAAARIREVLCCIHFCCDAIDGNGDHHCDDDAGIGMIMLTYIMLMLL